MEDEEGMKMLGVLMGKAMKAREPTLGPSKPMPEEAMALHRAFCAAVDPLIDERRRLEGEIEKVTAKLDCMKTEFGVDLRRLLPAPDNEAEAIKIDPDTRMYRCSVDTPEAKDEGTMTVSVAQDENGRIKLVGDKPPAWVQEMLAEAVAEMKDDEGPKTIQ